MGSEVAVEAEVVLTSKVYATPDTVVGALV
jgi:hypothetical protein